MSAESEPETAVVVEPDTAVVEVGPVVKEEKGDETTIQEFLARNPKLEKVKAMRDSKSGPVNIFKLLDVGIFGFLLFAPILAIIPTMEEPAVVVILWICIGMIMWCKIEYNNRAEVWWFCLCKGVILDFPKTNSAKGWLLQKPTFFAVVFLLVFGIVTYIGLDPQFKFRKPEIELVGAIMAIVGVLFVLMLTKSYVDMEGAPQLATLNIICFIFEDFDLLAHKGFAVVSFTALQHFIREKKKLKDKTFSWNEVHKLSHDPDAKEGVSLIGGTQMYMFLRKYKHFDE